MKIKHTSEKTFESCELDVPVNEKLVEALVQAVKNISNVPAILTNDEGTQISFGSLFPIDRKAGEKYTEGYKITITPIKDLN